MRSENRWPVVIGIIGILYLLFVILQFISIAMYYQYEGIPLERLNKWYFELILVFLVPVLFFIHTKRLAFLTAIPLVILTVLDAIYSLPGEGMWGTPEYTVTSLIPTLFSVVLMILYVVQMFARPKSPALSIVFLVLSVLDLGFLALVLVLTFFSPVTGYVSPASFFASLFGYIGLIFSLIAYTIAMFRSRKNA